jgi:hypothetical protein
MRRRGFLERYGKKRKIWKSTVSEALRETGQVGCSEFRFARYEHLQVNLVLIEQRLKIMGSQAISKVVMS